ncbi:DUF4179 domain-containing protein [Cytobacillus solani]|uniref:DUF4179 domain-containing protein n=1 Tax=Cytobacillus solani TaxID=1637975 RepID=A0A0Q3QKX5_9BACI|nr:DUF4179 domain-containing protein [Cytobacillus solani]KQL18256.1 hypothetical protein AN957_06420 [Cytobacillus solani]
MNKEKFNHSIDNIDIPLEKLVAREKTAMLQAKKRKKMGRTTRHSLLIACGLCMTLLGSGFVSTGMAEALSNIPLIGPIYAKFSDIASDKIQQDQLTTEIEKQDSQNGLTMTVKEAVYDGGRLIVTVEYTGQKKLSLTEETVGINDLTINGQSVKPAIASTGQDAIDSKTIIEHHQLTLSNHNEYGDKIEVAVHGENLFGYKGKWNVAFPLEKVDGVIHEFYPKVKTKTTDKDYAITVDKVTFSPLSTRIDLTIDYPAKMDENDTWPWFEFAVVDDKGQVYDRLKLQAGMAGDYGHHMVLVLPPMDEMPHSFIIKPAEINNKGYREEIKELELVVPLNKEK